MTPWLLYQVSWYLQFLIMPFFTAEVGGVSEITGRLQEWNSTSQHYQQTGGADSVVGLLSPSITNLH